MTIISVVGSFLYVCWGEGGDHEGGQVLFVVLILLYSTRLSFCPAVFPCRITSTSCTDGLVIKPVPHCWDKSFPQDGLIGTERLKCTLLKKHHGLQVLLIVHKYITRCAETLYKTLFKVAGVGRHVLDVGGDGCGVSGEGEIEDQVATG